MKVKRLSIILLMVILMVIGVAFNGFSETNTIQIGHVHRRDFPAHKALLKFAEYVDMNTNGEVKIEIFPDSALGSSAKIVERTKVGTVDSSLGYSGILQQYEPSFSVFSTFFLWTIMILCLNFLKVQLPRL